MTREAGDTVPVMLAVSPAAMAAGLAAADAAIVRALGGSEHPFVIRFFRATFGAMAALPWIAVRPGDLGGRHDHLRSRPVRVAGIGPRADRTRGQPLIFIWEESE